MAGLGINYKGFVITQSGKGLFQAFRKYPRLSFDGVSVAQLKAVIDRYLNLSAKVQVKRNRPRKNAARIAYIRAVWIDSEGDATVDWVDTSGKEGSTHGKANNAHMKALIARGRREHVQIYRENISSARLHAVQKIRHHQGKVLQKHYPGGQASKYYEKSMRAGRALIKRLAGNPNLSPKDMAYDLIRRFGNSSAALKSAVGNIKYSFGDERAYWVKVADWIARIRNAEYGNRPSRKAQAFIKRKIPQLVHKEGYSVPRAIGAAYGMAKAKGLKVNRKKAKKNPWIRGYQYLRPDGSPRSMAEIDEIKKIAKATRQQWESLAARPEIAEKYLHWYRTKSGPFYGKNISPLVAGAIGGASSLATKALLGKYSKKKRHKNISFERLGALGRARHAQGKGFAKQAKKYRYKRGIGKKMHKLAIEHYDKAIKAFTHPYQNPSNGIWAPFYKHFLGADTDRGEVPAGGTILANKLNRKLALIRGRRLSAEFDGAKIFKIRGSGNSTPGVPADRRFEHTFKPPYPVFYRTSKGLMGIKGSLNVYTPKDA